MFVSVVATLLVLRIVLSQYQFSNYDDIPSYIKRALNQKNQYKVEPKATKHITNLTLDEVVDRIKKITYSLNQHAKKNGYYVDYKFRIFEKK